MCRAEALTGDHDTPELIWTHAMRSQRLMPQLLQHLGDLALRLRQRNATTYDYTPLPPLVYPELSQEIWCHRYYLRNLCDETRFSNWPIVDHVPLLQVWNSTAGVTGATFRLNVQIRVSFFVVCSLVVISPLSDCRHGASDRKQTFI